jgi:hypothetical protein
VEYVHEPASHVHAENVHAGHSWGYILIQPSPTKKLQFTASKQPTLALCPKHPKQMSKHAVISVTCLQNLSTCRPFLFFFFSFLTQMNHFINSLRKNRDPSHQSTCRPLILSLDCVSGYLLHDIYVYTRDANKQTPASHFYLITIFCYLPSQSQGH